MSPANATESGSDGLILTSSNLGVIVQNADGSNPHTYTAHSVGNVSWSSDGSRIAWANRAGLCGIYTSAPDLTADWAMPGGGLGTDCYGDHPTWWDGNQKLVYSAGGGTSGTDQLYAEPIQPGAGAPTLLLGADSGFEDRHPVAVGNLVAFTRTPQYAIQPPQVWIYDKATGTAHKVLDNAQDADISPDGKSLVYTVPGDNDLYTSAIDGTGAAKLTSDGATVQHQTPAWSPTGTRIAFFDGSHSEVLDVASKAETVLAGSGSQPVWQPVNPNAPKPPLPPAPPPPPEPTAVQRVAGSDRYLTGVKVSQQYWSDKGDTSKDAALAKSVVLATGASFPDALAGGPLASAVDGPLLLTEPGTLTPQTQAEIQRVLPAGSTVYVLGGTAAISPAVANKVASLGYRIDRLGGSDRFGTSIAIAQEVERLVPAEPGQPRLAVVATGQSFADALSAGPLATTIGAPILLTDGSALSSSTRKFLTGKLSIPVGVPAYKALGVAPRPDSPCTMLAGSDRYSTSANVALCLSHLRAGANLAPIGLAGIATGTAYPDALTGGALMAYFGSPLLLTDPLSLSSATAGALRNATPHFYLVEIFGGSNAVSQGVERSVVNLLGARDLAPMLSGRSTEIRGLIQKQIATDIIGSSKRPAAAARSAVQ
ncbi:hypothetical protein GCM10009839_23440 [Catenulispora yoronensis]|uniref:Dipeptidylpeptidase IV N-terminal domain-containing protein n=1 Tax=Catenulispora yoronensis TaxID=450799 RepID=A0ABN2U078_9ACTN